MSTMADVRESKGRDKYGRTVLTVFVMKNYQHRPTGVVVSMPKVYREKYPGQNYLVNNWELRGDAAVTYHAKRADAVAFLKAELLRMDNEVKG